MHVYVCVVRLPVHAGSCAESLLWPLCILFLETVSLLLNFKSAVLTRWNVQTAPGIYLPPPLARDWSSGPYECQAITLPMKPHSQSCLVFPCMTLPFYWDQTTDPYFGGSKLWHPIFTFQHVEYILAKYSWGLPGSVKNVIIFRGLEITGKKKQQHLKSLVVDIKH